jgi:hypothetical protein
MVPYIPACTTAAFTITAAVLHSSTLAGMSVRRIINSVGSRAVGFPVRAVGAVVGAVGISVVVATAATAAIAATVGGGGGT